MNLNIKRIKCLIAVLIILLLSVTLLTSCKDSDANNGNNGNEDEYSENNCNEDDEKIYTLGLDAQTLNNKDGEAEYISGYYVGYNVKLIPLFNGPDFDGSNVSYSLKSGEATVDGSILTVNTPGEVIVYATYEYNGKTYTSDDLRMSFDYIEGTILTAEDLLEMSNSGEAFFLAADIDISAYENWAPIENFMGTLDGNGYTIKGLNISARSMEDNKGLFATLGGTVKNLNIEGNVYCSGEASNFGLLCGTSTGQIINVSATGKVEAPYSDCVGGIVGFGNGSYVSECVSDVSVTGREYVGGLVGNMSASRYSDVTVSDNLNKGRIVGENFVGGLYGAFSPIEKNNEVTITLIANRNVGEVLASGEFVGGITGRLEGEAHSVYGGMYYSNYSCVIKIYECKNEGMITGVKYVGGIVGQLYKYVSEVSALENRGEIYGNSYVGGCIGYSWSGARNLTNYNTVVGKSYVGGVAGYIGTLDKCTNNGEILVIGYMVGNDNEKLSYAGGVAGYVIGINNCVNNANIHATEAGNCIGGVAGMLYSSSYSSVSENNYNHGTVTGCGYVGGIFGFVDVEDLEEDQVLTVVANTNDGDVTGNEDYIGGVIGYAGRGKNSQSTERSYVNVLECKNEANVKGHNYVGGVVGSAGEGYYTVAEISICTNTGDVEGNDYVGGYVGCAGHNSKVKSLENSANVTGRAYVGGIVGSAYNVENCVNNGTLNITGYVLSSSNQSISYVGGIVGYTSSVINCTNNANIDVGAGGNYVGGIVGCCVTLTGNVNHGEIKGTSYLGGIAGYLSGASGQSVASNINDGAIIGTGNYVGGILGYVAVDYSGKVSNVVPLKITDCKNEAGVTGIDYVGGIAGKCEKYVDNSEVVLATNYSEGAITAEGENKGNIFGHID